MQTETRARIVFILGSVKNKDCLIYKVLEQPIMKAAIILGIDLRELQNCPFPRKFVSWDDQSWID